MYPYLFSGLIKCYCNGNYRGKMDRETPVYICSKYNNYNTCERNTIKESDLIYFVIKYCQNKNYTFEHTNEFVKTIIHQIKVSENKSIKIYYKDDNIQIWSHDIIQF